MDSSLFKKYSDFIYMHAGIYLSDRKEALVEGRIAKRMRILGISSHKDYFDFVTSSTGEAEIPRMLDAISTNVTHFFRESAHFDYLAENIQKWTLQGQTRFRLWSAASSSGEEPYTMAMVASEAIGNIVNVDLQLLATDISGPMLVRCRDALYQEEAISKLPPLFKNKYLKKTEQDNEAYYSVDSSIKQLLTIKRLNLSKPPFPMKGPFDAIFIRNVMIYFDLAVKQNLINEAYRLLKPGGILCIGHSESLTGLNHKFISEKPAAYRKPL